MLHGYVDVSMVVKGEVEETYEVVKVLLAEDASSEEDDQRYERYDAHISNNPFQLMFNAQQCDCRQRHCAYEPLSGCKLLLRWPDRVDSDVLIPAI